MKSKIALVLAALAGLTACGSGGGSPAAGASDGSLARVKKAGHLTVCSSNDVPYFYRDPKTKQLAGTDYDMVKTIGDRLGIHKIQMYEVPISGIIPALTAKRCDLISDNIAITIKRSKQVDFSAPMYRAGQALVVPKGNPAGIHTQADFHGHTVGSYLGTIQLDYLKGLAKKDKTIKVKEYKNIPEIIADLRAGRLDAGAFDDMVAVVHAEDEPFAPDRAGQLQAADRRLRGRGGVPQERRHVPPRVRRRGPPDHADGRPDHHAHQVGLTPADRFEPFPNCCDAAGSTRRPGQCSPSSTTTARNSCAAPD